MSFFNLVKEKARYKHAPVAPLVRLTHGAHHGPNFNLISKREWVRKQIQSSNCHWTSKLKFAKFDERFYKLLWVLDKAQTVKIFGFKKQLVHKSCPHRCSLQPKKKGTRVIFVHEYSLRSLRSLFDWGHVFVIYVARGKFCKTMKFGFCIFLEVSTIWRIQW